MSLMPILSDFFLSEDVKKMFNNKYIIFIGDSVNRSMYKDMVKLYQKNEHLTDNQLKIKGELTFENDRLIEGGQFGSMSNDTNYKEVREFRTEHVLMRFYFVTRCNSSYLQNICQTIRNDLKKPDVVIMNSCYWDLSRYGPKSVEQYKINLQIGIRSLLYVLPKETVFIWTAALPVSEDICGGFMGPPGTSNIDQKVRLRVRENAIEANRFAAEIANDLSIDFLDLHYFFRLQQFRRAYDGIHWDATAHRRISNLLLHHLCDCWDLPTPGRFVISVRDPIKVVDNKTEKENVKAVEAVKYDEIKSVRIDKEVVLKEVVKQVEEDDDGFVAIKLVDHNKRKKDDDAKKKAEEKVNSDQAQTYVISSFPSSPASSTSSIENRLPKEKFKEPPKTSVNETNDNKKQRREINTDDRQFAADNSTISNRRINNNIIPTQYFYQDNVFNYYNTTAYKFTDNMLKNSSYNFFNPNFFYHIPYDCYSQYYYSNSVYKYTSNSSNRSSTQSRHISKYKLVNKRN